MPLWLIIIFTVGPILFFEFMILVVRALAAVDNRDVEHDF